MTHEAGNRGQEDLSLLRGILLLALIAVSVLLNRGVIQGVHVSGDVELALQSPPSSNQYLLGQTIVFEGTVEFADQEEAAISKVRLVNVGSSPQLLDVQLPVDSTGGQFIDFSEVVPGTLLIKATFIDVDTVVVGGTTLGGSLGSSLGGSLGGQNLAGSGDFKGVTANAEIQYVVQYTPPVFLDPAPAFTLIPSTDDVFSIPLLSTPSAEAGTKLPSVDLKFAIPTVGAPTFAAVLPNASSTFNIPTVAVSTNASSGLPALHSLHDRGI